MFLVFGVYSGAEEGRPVTSPCTLRHDCTTTLLSVLNCLDCFCVSRSNLTGDAKPPLSSHLDDGGELLLQGG